MKEELLMILVFIISTLLGFKLIKAVPSLLHTPLMSGMNALSGVTLIGMISATALVTTTGSKAVGMIGIICATVNVMAGFGITDKILKMFKSDISENPEKSQ